MAMKKRRKQRKTVRAYMVESPHGPYVVAGTTLSEVMDCLHQVSMASELEEGEEIKITIKRFTKDEYANLAEV